MFILKKGHQPGVYVPLGALFLVLECAFGDLQNRKYHLGAQSGLTPSNKNKASISPGALPSE